MDFILNNAGTIAVLAIIVVLVCTAVIKLKKNKSSGKIWSCCTGCRGHCRDIQSCNKPE